jgi:hypothetical protein
MGIETPLSLSSARHWRPDALHEGGPMAGPEPVRPGSKLFLRCRKLSLIQVNVAELIDADPALEGLMAVRMFKGDHPNKVVVYTELPMLSVDTAKMAPEK